MTTITDPFTFSLDPELEAHEPPEARGVPRDQVRLMVSQGTAPPVHTRFDRVADQIDPGDLLVVNTSATIPAAIDGRLDSTGEQVVLHFSTELPAGLWLVEVRQPTASWSMPLQLSSADKVVLDSGGTVDLDAPFPGSKRLWIAAPHLDLPVLDLLALHGRAIRYRYVPQDWPIDTYHSVFSRWPGSAEMPSVSRAFSEAVIADLVRHGIVMAPLVLHTGVSSAEYSEPPYPERYLVPRTTASLINATRLSGGRVIAVGTTVVRAIATVTDDRTIVHPGAGWTEEFVTPERPPAAIDGLVTGWHEPEASHLLMLRAVAGDAIVDAAYSAAVEQRYLWHEFGDTHLLIREPYAMTEQPITVRRPGTAMPDGRRRVLYALRRRGPATATELARQLGMTVSGARQHLTSLVDDGHVTARETPSERPRRGRPTLTYAVTSHGDAEFPRAYGELTTELLGFLDEEQPEILNRLFERRRDDRTASATSRLAPYRSLRGKVGELTRILDEDGYFATCEPAPEGGFLIVEHNCAIWAVAQRFGQACTSEIDFIRAALADAEVQRVEHMATGGTRCAYEIRAKRSTAA